MNDFLSIFAAVIGLGFLIMIHEAGHFFAAKLFHVGVLEFSMGMGPRLFSRVYGNTRYSFKLLPFGGSCAMLGEDSAGSGDFLTASGTETESDILDFNGVRFRKSELHRYSFEKKPAWQRFIICFAGVFNNFLFAFLVSMLLVSVSGFDHPEVVGTEPLAAVSETDIREGDIVKGIGQAGHRLTGVNSFRELQIWLYINRDSLNDQALMELSLLRDGQKHTIRFRPFYSDAYKRYMLGISFNAGNRMPVGTAEFLRDSWYEFHYNVSVVIQSLRMLFKGQVDRTEVMGPVGTVTVVGETVQRSARYGLLNALLVLLSLLSALSANLGIMNLLPIPALDGGRLAFLLVEMLTGKTLDPKYQELIDGIFMSVILLLMLLIFSNDIWNLFTGAYAGLLGG